MHRLPLGLVVVLLAAQALAQSPPAATPTPAAPRWTGMGWSSPDGLVRASLTALAHLDSRAYLGDTASPDSFDVRRARLELSGTVSDWLRFRLQLALEDSPYLRNAFVELGRDERLRVRVGQMKVPFSTAWLTQDANLGAIERAGNTPIYPFLDRGVLLTGRLAKGAVTYNLGAFNGAGVELDAPKGDVDDHKDLVARLFVQPFRSREGSRLSGLYLAVGGTRSLSGAPTRRFETRGFATPNYESLFWRWRTEQVLATDGRATDQISGWISSRKRLGAEAHWLAGPFTASAEWANVRYGGVEVTHDFFLGSSRLRHEPVLARDGSVRQLAVWTSVFLTGERMSVDNGGWRLPAPRREYVPGRGGPGAWELYLRLADTRTDRGLFDAVKVAGFAPAALPVGVPAVGATESVTARVLDGAPHVREATLGVSWTMNAFLRLVLDVTRLSAVDAGPGEGIVSAGNSELADAVRRNLLVDSETMAAVRLQVRL